MGETTEDSMPFHPFRVRVPATTANLGPGFDCLGLALDLHNELSVRPAGEFSLRVRGEGEGQAPENERNLIWRTFAGLFERLGQPPPRVNLECLNRVPLARGLGSSAAARVAALVAANRCAGDPFAREELLQFAVEAEGHPDNVAPALLGGLVVCGADGDRAVAKRIEPKPGLRVVLLIPERKLSTEEARRALPKEVPLRDAVANLQNTALTALAFATGDYTLLKSSLSDRLHQPYRAPLMPGFLAALEAARDSGALGAALSGAGPTIAAFALGPLDPVMQGMKIVFEAAGGGANKVIALDVNLKGAEIESLSQ